MNKRIIVGLGNPGEEYEFTRHNVGFLALDTLKSRYGFPEFSVDKKLGAAVSGTIVGEDLVMLVKPLTFMNKSGEAVQRVLSYYKLEPSSMTVIYDDFDLPMGLLRKRDKGGPGTHNGMRNIVRILGTEDFPRVRVGIKPDHPVRDLSSFVLSRLGSSDREALQEVFDGLRIGETL